VKTVSPPDITLETIVVDGVEFLRLRNHDHMPRFFMTLASDTDAWAFVMSSGGMTAGRTDPDGALFPYTTVDRLTYAHRHSGPVTLIRAGDTVWNPFTDDPHPRVDRHLDKSVLGHQLAWDVTHHDLSLHCRFRWATCEPFGHVRTVTLRNPGDAPITFDLLDGMRNVLPSGVPLPLMQTSSCLVDAYKRADVDPATGLTTIALTARIIDRAEAAEALRATTVWSRGLDDARLALSPDTVAKFRRGDPIDDETRLAGRPVGVFNQATLTLQPGESRTWHLVADVGRDHVQVEELRSLLAGDDDLDEAITKTLEASTRDLESLLARADGFQCTAQRVDDHHHTANVLFNVMRGGTFYQDGAIPPDDFQRFLRVRTGDRPTKLSGERIDTLAGLMERTAVAGLEDEYRLALEYLPLHFGRRHGDPSRPWNRFSIRVRDHRGERVLHYEGNWRDIFQNWEALALSFPRFLPNMIARFVNASTVDGFNPYRVTREGVDWEVEDPDDPWSTIGYWGDHQIIYLLKLIEWAEDAVPEDFERMLATSAFTYVDVPYRLRSYAEIVADPHHTIDFDEEAAARIARRVETEGTDGQLVRRSDGTIVRVSLLEKLLVPVLSKLSNLVADGGIWMNTQRPEWNDANNALVGNGVSMVTLCYLRRYLARLWPLYHGTDGFTMSHAVRVWLDEVRGVLERFRSVLDARPVDDRMRRALLDGLGEAFERYRDRVAEGGLDRSESVSGRSVATLFSVAGEFVDHAIGTNRRDDGLVHAYNIMTLADDEARLERLQVMLEGQVAAISSGGLDDDEVLGIVDALFEGPLYRADQNSFLLYPEKTLPTFLERNDVDAEKATAIPLLDAMLDAGDTSIVARDAAGHLRFHGDFTNADDVAAALDEAARDERWRARVDADRDAVLALFEDTFHHRAFTGRSGTMYGYEGLGCIYWHMVAKLLLAVQEVALRRADRDEHDTTFGRLVDAYYRVRSGLGFSKTPQEFGAFPTDPYSHTPPHAGAQQPGMTGQVKEEILTRMGELGLVFEDGCVAFRPRLLRAGEFLEHVDSLTVIDTEGRRDRIEIAPGQLAFTVMGVPVVYSKGDASAIVVHGRDGTKTTVDGDRLDPDTSQRLIDRDGSVVRIDVTVRTAELLE